MLALNRRIDVIGQVQTVMSGISHSQLSALREISRAGSISLITLSTILGLDTSTLSRTVNNLVDLRLANRETDPADRRYVTISLTENGEKLSRNVEAVLDFYCLGLIMEIPETERAAVLDGLQTLLNAFEAVGGATAAKPPGQSASRQAVPGHEALVRSVFDS